MKLAPTNIDEPFVKRTSLAGFGTDKQCLLKEHIKAFTQHQTALSLATLGGAHASM